MIVRLALGWILGAASVIVALVCLPRYPAASIVIGVAALLVFPPTWKIISSRLRIADLQWIRVMMVLLLYAVSSVYILNAYLRSEHDASALLAQEREIARLARSQSIHSEFLGLDTWNHAIYVRENGPHLCVICHSLTANGPNMSGRGPRCVSCHHIDQIEALSRDDDGRMHYGHLENEGR